MQLSEAIFLGSKLSKQAFGVLCDHDGGTCAYGAALKAIGGKGIAREWPWIADVTHTMPCPECGEVESVGAIPSTHLNDMHRWTRERIADWVATVEPREEPTSCPETVQTSLVTVAL